MIRNLFTRGSAMAVSLALSACPPTMNPTMDSGMEPVEEMVEYEGEATGSPPDFAGDIIDAGNRTPIDAGEAVVDTRCCKLNFSIEAAGEPEGAVATLVGQAEPLLRGIALTKSDGGYTANACFPMESSTYYWYQFEWLTADADAGGLDMGDGGFWVTSLRHSEQELSYAVGDGSRKNYIPAVMSCAELDAGMDP